MRKHAGNGRGITEEDRTILEELWDLI
jgi:hypothetical protein